MATYSNVSIILGSAQSCIAAIKAGDTNTSIQSASKAEGIAQTLLIKTIKDIYNYYNYSRKDIEAWASSGKIHGFHKDSFLKYAEK